MANRSDQDSANSSFGDVLRSHRIARALSQEALAAKSGMSLRAISDLERGARKRPYMESVRMLADALELTASDRSSFALAARHGPNTEFAAPSLPNGLEPADLSIPQPQTSLVGRETDILNVVDLLRQSDVRLVTVTGPAGVGKTRLAIAVAGDRTGAFRDGVNFVDLTHVSGSHMVLPAIATTIGLFATGAEDLVSRLLECLRTRHLLVVLDNVDHVADAVPTALNVLKQVPGMKFLITSRKRLNLAWEHEFVVSPLAAPPESSRLSARQALEWPAVRLLLDRAETACFGFTLTDDIASTVGATVRRLDGLPLAIELAAARIQADSIVQGLDNLCELRALADGSEDHFQLLWDAIDWSYQQLTRSQQTVFSRLSVFCGNFSLGAAQFVAGDDYGDRVIDAVSALVDQNLIQRSSGSASEPRFWMLETIRSFAAKRLLEAGELEKAQTHHAEYLAFLAELAESESIGQPTLEPLER